MSTALVNATVIPVVPRGTIHDPGTIVFDDHGTITHVGTVDDDVVSQCSQVLDGTGRIVIPGLINAHCHSHSNWGKGLIERLPLEIWRQYLKACWRRLTDQDVYLSGLLTSIESLQSGCTTVLDHYYTAIDSPYAGADGIVKAWRETGVRGSLAPMVSDKRFQDTLPLGSEEVAGVREQVDQISASETATRLELVRRLSEDFADPTRRFNVILGPAAPQRCSDALLQESLQLAEELDVNLHMHVVETRAQAAYFMKNHGHGAIRYLHDRGLLSPRVSMAHVCHVPETEIDLIASGGATVVHNPVSNLKLGSGIAPVIDYLRRGINVALGTDGSASNDSQNMFETMKLSAILHCVTDTDSRGWIGAEAALRMATLGGAIALGLQDVCGSIEPGKAADLTVVDTATPAFTPLNDPVRQLVYAENGSGVTDVFVGGRHVVRDGMVTGVDARNVYEEVETSRARLAAGFHDEIEKTRPLEGVLRRMYEQL